MPPNKRQLKEAKETKAPRVNRRKKATKLEKPSKQKKRTHPDGDSAASVNADGTAPTLRIHNSVVAYNLYRKLLKENESTAYVRARIQGQIDGNSPTRPSRLKAAGLGNEPNVNYREAASVIDNKNGSMWRMLMEVPLFINLEPNAPMDPRMWPQMASGIATAFTKTLRERWTDFGWQVALRNQELLKFGIGPVFWQDEWDYRSDFTEASNLLIPAGTRACPSKIDFCAIRGTLQMPEVFRLIENQYMEEEGWNSEALKNAVLKFFSDAGKGENKYQNSTFESIQQAVRNKDSNDTCEFEELRVVHLFNLEYGGSSRGKITHNIIAENWQCEDFLYHRPGRYHEMKHALQPFIYRPNTGYFAGQHGVGHQMFPFFELSNMLLNKTVSGAVLSGSLIVQPTSDAASTKLKMSRQGPITIMDPRVNAIQSSFMPPIDKMIQVRHMLQQLANNNYGIYKVGQETWVDKERTAREVSIQSQNEAIFDQNDAAFYYTQWTEWLRETFRRLANPNYPKHAGGYEDHQFFMALCAKHKVEPEQVNPELWHITAEKSIGLGSQMMALDYTEQLMNRIQYFDEVGQKEIIRGWVAQRGGATSVEKYLPNDIEGRPPTDDDSVAVLENLAIKAGEPVLAGADQFHVAHIVRHLEPVTVLLQQYQQQGGSEQQPQGQQQGEQFDLGQAVQTIGGQLNHIGEHLKFMAKDPAKKVILKTFVETVKQVAQIFKEMVADWKKLRKKQAAIQQQQQQMMAQQREQEMDPEMQLKWKRAEDDMILNRAKQEAIATERERKTTHALNLKTARFESEQALKRQEAASE